MLNRENYVSIFCHRPKNLLSVSNASRTLFLHLHVCLTSLIGVLHQQGLSGGNKTGRTTSCDSSAALCQDKVLAQLKHKLCLFLLLKKDISAL